jgi:hypothetical protein
VRRARPEQSNTCSGTSILQSHNADILRPLISRIAVDCRENLVIGETGGDQNRVPPGKSTNAETDWALRTNWMKTGVSTPRSSQGQWRRRHLNLAIVRHVPVQPVMTDRFRAMQCRSWLTCWSTASAILLRNATPSVLHQHHIGRMLRSSCNVRGRRIASSRGREHRLGRCPPLWPGDLRNDGGSVSAAGADGSEA